MKVTANFLRNETNATFELFTVILENNSIIINIGKDKVKQF